MARALGRGVTVARLGGEHLLLLLLASERVTYFLPTYFLLKYSLGVSLFSTSKVYLFITLRFII